MNDYRHLFQRSIAAAPDRVHFAAHSHHLWPDASYLGQIACWQDAARLADRKWGRVMDELWPAAQAHVADELHLPDPSTVVFAGNTHDFLIRIASALAGRPLRILTSEGEFHSFRRQVARWEEAGQAVVHRVAVGDTMVDAMIGAAATFKPDLIYVSQVMFGTGFIVPGWQRLAQLADPAGPWVVIDGYHGFMAIDTDLSAVADRVFYLSGGYKYAMSGEGVAMMHAPPGYCDRPVLTGWYAEFEDVQLPPGHVGYAPDARRFMGATFDPSGLYRFVAVRDMLRGERLDTAAISGHALTLRQRVLAALPDTILRDAQVLNPGIEGPLARFISIRSPDAASIQARLAAQDVMTDVRGDVLRIGLGLYQSSRDVDVLIDCLAG
ncbi:aminotransferase class V-fold PLP-dependent enzyme [Sphingomonas sp. CJ99]